MNINPTTSGLGFTTGQFAAYQCSLVEPGITPTWSVTNLPPGLSMNAGGLISGQPTATGIYNSVISATSGATTATLPVTFGIDDGGFQIGAGIEVNFDIVSGFVTFPTSPDKMLHGKPADHLPLLIALQKNGVSMDLPVLGISFGLKEFESDNRLILSDPNQFTKVGTYERTRWSTLAYLDPEVLKNPLADYDSRNQVGGAAAAETTDPSLLITLLSAPCEIKIEIAQLDENLTPSTITRTSQIFSLLLERAITNV